MLSLPTLILSFAAAATPGKSNLIISPCRAGDHYQYETVSCSFELKNVGDAPIQVSKGEAKTSGDYIAPGVITVAPHSSSYIDVKVQLGDSEGDTQRTFVFESSEKGQERRGSTVFAFVSSVLDQARPTIDFGDVDLSGALPERSIELTSREVADFRILRVESKPDYLDVAIGPDGRTLKAKIRPDAPWGMRDRDGIIVGLNARQQLKARVAIKANLIGEVVADGSPYSLGLMRTNTKNRFLIRVSSRASRDFKIGRIELDGIKGVTEVVPCTPAAKGCKLVALTIASNQPTGRIDGFLRIALPDHGRELPVEVIGMLLEPDVKVHDMNAELEKARAKAGSLASEAPQKPATIDLKNAISGAVKEEAPPPPGHGPLLRWSVANEGSVYGYLIYRAESEQGPFLRVNPEIIRATDAFSGTVETYQFRDNSALSGMTYWYTIGIVKRTGKKDLLGSPQKVVAK